MAANTFAEVPVIVQYENTPLIRVIRDPQGAYMPEILVCHSDGTPLATVVGTSISTARDRDRAAITVSSTDGMTICTVAGRTAFQMRRDDAATLKVQAELYTPDGSLVSVDKSPRISVRQGAGATAEDWGTTRVGNVFHGRQIGILLMQDGTIAYGVGPATYDQ